MNQTIKKIIMKQIFLKILAFKSVQNDVTNLRNNEIG